MLEKFEGFREKQSNQQTQKMEFSIAKNEEQSVACEMKKEGDNPLLELLNPFREDNYIPHQLLKRKSKNNRRDCVCR